MHFTVYKSSAGSGKTFTLVKEYLKIALGTETADSYRYILAITFTNKAASEMKDRVLDALKSLSADTAPTGTALYLHAALEEELALPTQVLRERAERVLEHILHHYGDFSISTIDKFVHRVVRAFAFDLKIPLNFDVELDQEELLREAIDLLIEQVGTNEHLTQLLVDFTEAKTDQEKSWNIEFDLEGLGKNIFKEDSAIYMERLKALSLEDFHAIRASIAERVDAFKDAVKAIGTQALEVISNAGVAHAHFAGGAARGIGKYFTYLAVFQQKSLEAKPTLLKNIEEDKWYSSKAKKLEQAGIDGIKEALLVLFQKAQTLHEQHFAQFELYDLLNRHIHGLAVLNEIEGLMDRIKEEESLVHISEFNKRIADIVLNEPVPFIYERLGEKYRHYLVDEFQDTSTMQWQNLLPLLDNALGHGHFNMVVGDGKQAIYRWRGGEVEQFSRLPEVSSQTNNPLVQERAGALSRNYKGEVLKRNYRSKAEIVEFNNNLFEHLSGHLEEHLAKIYFEQSQEFDANNLGGLVQADMYGELTTKQDYREWTAEHVERSVRDALTDGYQLADIAIVTRNKKDGSGIANHLIEQGLDVVSTESLLLSGSANVRFVMACLLYLKDGNSKRAQTLMVNFLLSTGRIAGVVHEVLARIADRETRFSLTEFLKENGFEFYAGGLRQLPLYEMTEAIVLLFNLAPGPDPFITYLLENVQEFSARTQPGLDDLVKWWEDKQHKLSIQVPEGTNAISVMTIHKSKGLEFPVVIVPFADWKILNSNSHLWIELNEPGIEQLDTALVPASKQLETTEYASRYREETDRSLLDNFNLLYVAFTRPRERLYITLKDQRNSITEYYANFLLNHPDWVPEASHLLTGTRMPPSALGTDAGEGVTELKSLVMGDWRKRLAISMQAGKLWGAEPEFTNPSLPPQLVRTALAELESADEIQDVVDSLQIQGIANGMEAGLLSEKLNRLLDKPDIRPFFEPGLKVAIEKDILMENGQSLRPDRLIHSGSRAQLVGFKAGKELSGQIKLLEKQASVLRSMGYDFVDKYLLDAERETVVKL